MVALPHGDREKLIKLLGMLASAYDGERANAARLANELIRRHGLQWGDVIAPASAGSKPGNRNHAETADWLLRENARLEALTAWERQFLTDLRGFAKLSPKQRATLDRLVDKVAEAMEMADAC